MDASFLLNTKASSAFTLEQLAQERGPHSFRTLKAPIPSHTAAEIPDPTEDKWERWVYQAVNRIGRLVG